MARQSRAEGASRNFLQGSASNRPKFVTRKPTELLPESPAVVSIAHELEEFHTRIIALENLVASVLSTATEEQLANARDTAQLIAPKEGYTQHPLTVQASERMRDLIAKAEHLRENLAKVE
ncbi:MAG: hypothetical protein AB7H77_03605 [Bdellovibrionales bacterium]